MIKQNTTIYGASMLKMDAEKKIVDAINEYTEKTGLIVYGVNFKKESITSLLNDEERVCYYDISLEVKL